MKLFPFRRPSLGLSIEADTLALAEVRRGWGRLSLRRCAERDLPDGLVRVTATGPNVADVAALSKEVSALLADQKMSSRPVPIALSLPDLCGRVTLLEFDSLPQKPPEADALIRWQFQRDMNLPGEELRFTCQTFRPPSVRGSGREPVRVLAAGIRDQVVEPYERACELAGILPVSVGLAGLQLFDLYRPVIETALNTTRECFYLYVEEGSFAFIAIRAGVPVFLRIKSLRNGNMNGNAASHRLAVEEELLATLHFYMEQETVSSEGPVSARPLFLINGEGHVPALPDSLGVTVVPIGWGDFRIAKQSATVPSCAGLPAFAGVMEM